jgi:hypothetical protein
MKNFITLYNKCCKILTTSWKEGNNQQWIKYFTFCHIQKYEFWDISAKNARIVLFYVKKVEQEKQKPTNRYFFVLCKITLSKINGQEHHYRPL